MKAATRRVILPGVIAISVTGMILLGFSLWTSGSVRTYRMPNHAMAPTIEKGDRVSVDLRAYSESDPKFGDLVMFRPAGAGDLKWIFRIAAIPGDVVGYDEGRLVRNGSVLVAPEPLQDQIYAAPGCMRASVEIAYPYRLDPGEYFLLSDDPEHMHDSRYWGLVDREQILARVTSHE